VGNGGDLVESGRAVDVMAATAGGVIRERRGLRITLLSLAAAILLLGAVVAGAFCYLMLASG
jgi:hypothetical protein